MPEPIAGPALVVVDALELPAEYRALLRPGECVPDGQGRARRLPRHFFEIDSWRTARKLRLTPDFTLSEFISVDVREAELLRGFPRYVPCAVTLLAAQLQRFRDVVGAPVHIAANGGYRSPAHALSTQASPHQWACAVNIYRIGDELLDEQETIERYNAIALSAVPGLWARPYGHGAGFADDHVHLDIGYVTVVPRDAASELEVELRVIGTSSALAPAPDGA